MKILKVYDKINRNTIHYEPNSGNLTLKEYLEEDVINIIINTKITLLIFQALICTLLIYLIDLCVHKFL